jgi:hypothetical protein
MAKDKPKKRDDPKAARKAAAKRAAVGDQAKERTGAKDHTGAGGDASGTQHHPAVAHGKPARVDMSLPATRAELVALHAEARRRRNTAPLGGEAFRAAVDEIARIEIRVADVDRAADPPLG